MLWKKRFTEIFVPSLTFYVKENATHLCCGLQTHRLLLSGTQEASLPPGVSTTCFQGLISISFKEGSLQGNALQKASLDSSFKRVLSSQSCTIMVQYGVYLNLPFF